MSSFSTRRTFFAFLATLAFGLPAATAQDARRAYVPPALDTVHAVPAEHGMVVAQEKISAQVGADILRRGGNAVDAAVATGFAMAVTYPRAGNIGGGGFMVIHSTSATKTSRSIIARPRRLRPRRRFSSAPTASPMRRSRGIPRSASACPAPSRVLRWPWKNMARAGSRWRNCSSPRSARPRWLPRRRRHCRHAAGLAQAAGALALLGQDLLAARWHAARRRRQAGAERSRRNAVGRRRTGPARFL